MKRLLFPAFVVVLMTPAVMLAVAACDPDLTPKVVPGEGGAFEASPADSAPLPPDDSGMTTEGGTDGGTEAGLIDHLIDGTNDFTAGQKFATTSAGYDGYVSWDEKKVYFGMSGADIAAGAESNTKWVLVYVDGNLANLGNSGSAVGIGYNCGGGCNAQQANLPFNAGYHIRWKADGIYTNVQKWSGTAWVDHVAMLNTFDRKGTFMELSITRALLGNPVKLKVAMAMVIEKPGAERTYAGVPTMSFTDGNAPASFTKYFEFDLADTAKAPNTYPPK